MGPFRGQNLSAWSYANPPPPVFCSIIPAASSVQPPRRRCPPREGLGDHEGGGGAAAGAVVCRAAGGAGLAGGTAAARAGVDRRAPACELPEQREQHRCEVAGTRRVRARGRRASFGLTVGDMFVVLPSPPQAVSPEIESARHQGFST